MTDAIAAEFLKFRTLRANLYLLISSLAAVGLSAGVAFLVTRGFDNQQGADLRRFDSLGDGLGGGLPFAHLVIGALGALSVTTEYGTGHIGTSLTAVPARHTFLLAKIPVLVAVSLVAGQVLVFGMYAATMAVLGTRADTVLLGGETLGASLSEPGVLAGLLITGASMPLVALIGLGLGTAIRSTAGTLVTLTALLVILPVAAQTLPRPLGYQVGAHLIGALPAQIAAEGLLTPISAGALLAAYTVAALAAAAVAVALRGRRVRPLLAGSVATVVLVGATSASAAAPPASTLAWKPCDKMLCGEIRVPVDWTEPRGRTITLPLAMLPHTGRRHRVGVLFSIPGGPGGSGVRDLERHAGSFAQIRDSFDVVSLLPRNGIELGVLDQDCLTTGPWITRPDSERDWGALARSNRAAAEACRAADPELFAHLDSASFARDIDAIRAAMGERRLTLMATSYGGVPGIAYARLFPGRVRAMYLDGSVNTLRGRTEQDRARYTLMEAQFARFSRWCANDSACALHGRDVGTAWDHLVSAADRSPVPAENGVAYTGFDITVAAMPHIVTPGEDNARWKELARAIRRAGQGDATGFSDYVKAGTLGSVKPPSPVGMNMTHCLDGIRYRDYAEYRRSRALGDRIAPRLSGSGLWHPLGCVGWPEPARDLAAPLPVDRLPPFVGAGTWTDYADTADLALRVPGSGTIRFEGPGHGLYHTGDPCTIAYANRYFVDLRVPPGDTTCRAES
ncbi:alpha/beta fold hydrolase [Streptosporangium sp. NPDC002721]|uniref:alpha/beta fold hydrolase n=1 Tax=Streptosporangium sp. NPDC002721 TaxID=3366188 RepID=UPI003690E588